jgi:hypothetical protein
MADPNTKQGGGLLGGFFGPDGRDQRQRLALALQGMTMSPNQAFISQLQADIQGREEQRKTNATAEWLRARGRADLADAMGAGLSPAEAMQMAMQPADPMAAINLERAQLELANLRNPQPGYRQVTGADLGLTGPDAAKMFNVSPEGQVTPISGVGTAGGPQSAIAKLQADLNAGLITKEQYDIAAAGMAPAGISVETGPDGQLRVVQGAGAGGIAGKPFTEGQSKDIVYSTRAKGALAAFEPVAGALTSLPGRAAEYDPTGIVRSRVQSPEFQVAKQAGDEFLNAILRKDTGAAITPAEQELYGKNYLPQPGDGPDVLVAKQAARARAVAAIEAGMSPAQMIAQEKGLAGAGAPSPAGGTVTITNDAEYDALASGTMFIGPDGKTRRKP